MVSKTFEDSVYHFTEDIFKQLLDTFQGKTMGKDVSLDIMMNGFFGDKGKGKNVILKQEISNNIDKDKNEKMALPIKLLKLSEIHNSFKASKSQEEYYRENGSSEDILQYVRIPGKAFGEKWCEKLCKEHFKLDNRLSSGHDHCKLNKKIEQKSARYGGNGAEWKWQHIEMKHEWDYIILCGLEFLGFRFYIASRKIIEDLINKKVITGQGAKDEKGVAQAQQAYWFMKSNFKKKTLQFNNYFTEINDEKSLTNYIHMSISSTPL